MISKSEIKFITSLQQKKYRLIHGLFLAEGVKIIKDFLASGAKLNALFTTESVQDNFEEATLISEKELKKISNLKTPNGALAIFEIPEFVEKPNDGLVLVLDAVRDPGNLGTIIRLADWFGLKKIVCSPDTVDCYNEKVVQATMGSLARVEVQYFPLITFLKNAELPIYAAVLKGKNVYKQTLPEKGILVMGNESNGISREVLKFVTNPITIPSFSIGKTAESLNVSTATAILLSEFKRTTEK